MNKSHKIHKFIKSFFFGLLLALPQMGFAQDLTGAGATFPFPLYSAWFSQYQKVAPEVQINYQSIGSGAGVKMFTQGTVDFGATDSPINDEQLQKLSFKVYQIPTVMGAVVVTYSLPQLTLPLNLSASVLSQIFLGQIKIWNDSQIQTLNPKVKLPEIPILVIHRADGSGTTAIFTEYLSKVSPQWNKSVGNGSAVSWPTGLGGKGNDGVSALVKQNQGAIGYVELIYAKTNQMAFARIQNQKGQMVEPTLQSIMASVSPQIKKGDFRVSLTHSDNVGAYPICGMTYLLISSSLPLQKRQALSSMIKWALTQGQDQARQLSYAPLPETLTKSVLKQLDEIQ